MQPIEERQGLGKDVEQSTVLTLLEDLEYSEVEGLKSMQVLLTTASGRFIQVSWFAAQLLQLVDGRRTSRELTHELKKKYPHHDLGSLREAQMGLLHNRLMPLGLVSDGSETSPIRKRKTILWPRLRLVSAGRVDAVAGRMRFLFRRMWVVFSLALIVVTRLSIYASATLQPLGESQYGPLSVTLPAVLLGMLVHEFGHTAALKAFGGRPGEIGCGMYFYIPVFYTDLSAAWRLPRLARASVDLGGVYFVSLYGSLLFLCALPASSAAVTAGIALLDFSSLLSLNPFLRMDGYWLLSDLAGVRNLRESSNEAISTLLNNGPANRSRGARFLLMYGLASQMFFAWATWMVLRFTIPGLVERIVERPRKVLSGSLTNLGGFLRASGEAIACGLEIIILLAIVACVVRLACSLVKPLALLMKRIISAPGAEVPES